MHLYGYYRSSSSYRMRIALNLKGLAPEQTFIHLRKGDQFGDDYVKLHPQHQLPTLHTDRRHPLPPSPPRVASDRRRQAGGETASGTWPASRRAAMASTHWSR